jgi:putative endonuclease
VSSSSGEAEESGGGDHKVHRFYAIIPSIMTEYYIYIMSNQSATLYTGVTNDLEQRVYQHKHKSVDSFTKRYNISQLVYFESTDDVAAAIAREKQIKGLLRSKKLELIKTLNPLFKDLSQEWFDS